MSTLAIKRINFGKTRKSDTDLRVELLHMGDKLAELSNSIGQLSRLYSTMGSDLTVRNLREFRNLMNKYRKERRRLQKKIDRLTTRMELAQHS